MGVKRRGRNTSGKMLAATKEVYAHAYAGERRYVTLLDMGHISY